eukprot:NODE_718_length_1840_cov_14.461195_g584_i0.p1 GENE.NODE_718_length_1840_cov_14.461195_g584_i0~~NODE_718_length_1840_cov_14.461195_g584_i0.p1  ORF type:complete len:600 (+),score=193.90 NODE_718_length_1840_cov_14.461195_g584_i0:3-1802(+)
MESVHELERAEVQINEHQGRISIMTQEAEGYLLLFSVETALHGKLRALESIQSLQVLQGRAATELQADEERAWKALMDLLRMTPRSKVAAKRGGKGGKGAVGFAEKGRGPRLRPTTHTLGVEHQEKQARRVTEADYDRQCREIAKAMDGDRVIRSAIMQQQETRSRRNVKSTEEAARLVLRHFLACLRLMGRQNQARTVIKTTEANERTDLATLKAEHKRFSTTLSRLLDAETEWRVESMRLERSDWDVIIQAWRQVTSLRTTQERAAFDELALIQDAEETERVFFGKAESTLRAALATNEAAGRRLAEKQSELREARLLAEDASAWETRLEREKRADLKTVERLQQQWEKEYQDMMKADAAVTLEAFVRIYQAKKEKVKRRVANNSRFEAEKLSGQVIRAQRFLRGWLSRLKTGRTLGAIRDFMKDENAARAKVAKEWFSELVRTISRVNHRLNIHFAEELARSRIQESEDAVRALLGRLLLADRRAAWKITCVDLNGEEALVRSHLESAQSRAAAGIFDAFVAQMAISADNAQREQGLVQQVVSAESAARDMILEAAATVFREMQEALLLQLVAFYHQNVSARPTSQSSSSRPATSS